MSTHSLGLKKLHPPTGRLAGEDLSVALLVLFLTQRPEVCEPPGCIARDSDASGHAEIHHR